MAEPWFKHMAPRGRAANTSSASLSASVREFMEAILDDNDPRRDELRAANATEDSPSPGQLFAEAVLENPPPRRAAPAAANTTEFSPPSAAQEFADAVLGRPEQVDTREFLAQVCPLHEGTWDSSKHPRGGDPQNRGRWSPADGEGGDGGVRDTPDRASAERKSDSAANQKRVNQHDAPPAMVALAHAWRETHELL